MNPARTVVTSIKWRLRSESLVIRLGTIIENGILVSVKTEARIPALASPTPA